MACMFIGKAQVKHFNVYCLDMYVILYIHLHVQLLMLLFPKYHRRKLTYGCIDTI